ncbi:MAG: hypothetical protein H7061_10380 [Bdellovibrionaceae bacterium]|nr:hypothetical protein [Bdellovibrio sp.]
MILLVTPFLLQAIAMFFDEFYFHFRRELKTWERLGHPLDTFSVLICYFYLYTHSYSEMNLKVFIALAAFSCLFITKDEWVHKDVASAHENWLHAVLFILHPLCFLAAALVWRDNLIPHFILIQAVVLFLFMTYQILYWSIPWKKRLNP